MEDGSCYCEFGEFEALDREELDMNRDWTWEWEMEDAYRLQAEEVSEDLLSLLS